MALNIGKPEFQAIVRSAIEEAANEGRENHLADLARKGNALSAVEQRTNVEEARKIDDLVTMITELAVNDQRGEAPGPATAITREELARVATFATERGIGPTDIDRAVTMLRERAQALPIADKAALADARAMLEMIKSLQGEMAKLEARDWACRVIDATEPDEIWAEDSPLRDRRGLAKTLRAEGLFSDAQLSALETPDWERTVAATCTTRIRPGDTRDWNRKLPGVPMPTTAAPAQSRRRPRPVPVEPLASSDLSQQQYDELSENVWRAIEEVGLPSEERQRAWQQFRDLMQRGRLELEPVKVTTTDPLLAVVQHLYDQHYGKTILGHPRHATAHGFWDARSRTAFGTEVTLGTIAALLKPRS